MILTPHLVIGAIIGAKIEFLPFAIILAFLSHYFLDSLPHAEYLIENIKGERWNRSGLDFLKLTLDLVAGLTIILIVYFITKINYLVLFAAAFFAVLPDILIVLSWIFSNNKFLEKHFNFHHRVHFSKDKKTPIWEKLVTEVFVVLFGLLFLLVKI